MEMLQLHAFTILARYENMSMVAQDLNTSQPQVSKLITSLEAELGVQLFDRVGRGLRLNEHGRLFRQYAEDALSSMKSGKIAMKNLRNALLGTIRLGTFAFASILDPCILSFTQKNAYVNFRYSKNPDTLQRDVDIILVPFQQGHYSAERHFPVSFRVLEEDFYLVVTPKLHVFPRGKTSIDLLDTKDFPYIVMERSNVYPSSDHGIIENMTNLLGFTPHIAYEPCEFVTKMLLVARGAGVAFLPSACLPTARLLSPDLQVFSIENFSTHRSVLLARKRRSLMPPAAAAFWDHAVEFFHQPPDTEF